MKKLHIITIFCFILYIIYKLNRKSYVIRGQDSSEQQQQHRQQQHRQQQHRYNNTGSSNTGSSNSSRAGTTAGAGTTPDPLADLVAQAANAFQVELDGTQDLSNAAFPTYEGAYEAENIINHTEDVIC